MDTFQKGCRRYLKSCKKRAGTFATNEIETEAKICALGAESELHNRKPVASIRSALVARFANLEKMIARGNAE